MRTTTVLTVFVASITLLIAAMLPMALAQEQARPDTRAQHPAAPHADGEPGEVLEHAEMFAGIDQLVAVLHPTQGHNVHGVVRFREVGDDVQVVATVEGLTPGSKHGFHIHEYGDCTAPDATSAGGHYDPEGHPHALPGNQPRHAGDLGNLVANEHGVAHYEAVVENITLAGLENPILGRAVIVHVQEDTGEQPTGGAGARMACGVIGIANPESAAAE